MQKVHYYILLFLIFLVSCNKENSEQTITSKEKTVSIRLAHKQDFQTRVIDEDNLASEQIINNLSIFFTEPSSLTVTDKYIHTGFSTSGEYKLVSLPVEPADLLTKDIYVVANYDNLSNLEAITSIDGLRELHTPEVNKSNNLNPANGFCMSGSTLNFNFNSGSDVPATVGLVRTCAKIKVNLTFPLTPGLSTENSFLMQEAAMYTFVMANPNTVVPQNDFFNFAAPISLIDNRAEVYTNNAYVYESSHAPVITVYTYINDISEQQEFTTTLPIPVRNYLYELDIQVFEDEEETGTRSISGEKINLRYKTNLTIYNEIGEIVH